MNTDTIKATFTYITALTVVLGGFVLIYLTRLDDSATSMQLLIGGFIGSALTFLFVQENSTRTSRTNERQFTQGAQTSMGMTQAPPAPPAVKEP